ncbi:MAG: cupin domain-containing protein [Sphingobacteriales bacterium]|nr:MAG: cupin domain-containing protein [Sphingobacteriales bacterium]
MSRDMEKHGKLSRTIENPVNGEIVTFIKTGAETNGEYMLAEVQLQPNGKIPAHYHTIFTERFKVLEGKLDLVVDKKKITLQAGEELIVKSPQVHRFCNTSGKIVRFENELRPAGNFEKAARVGDGLVADGKGNKQGLPKNIFQLALIFEWVGSYFPGVPASMQKNIFGLLAKIAKLRGMDKELEKYY